MPLPRRRLPYEGADERPVPPFATASVPVVEAKGIVRFKDEVAMEETAPLVPKRRPFKEPRVRELAETEFKALAPFTDKVPIEPLVE